MVCPEVWESVSTSNNYPGMLFIYHGGGDYVSMGNVWLKMDPGLVNYGHCIHGCSGDTFSIDEGIVIPLRDNTTRVVLTWYCSGEWIWIDWNNIPSRKNMEV